MSNWVDNSHVSTAARNHQVTYHTSAFMLFTSTCLHRLFEHYPVWFSHHPKLNFNYDKSELIESKKQSKNFFAFVISILANFFVFCVIRSWLFFVFCFFFYFILTLPAPLSPYSGPLSQTVRSSFVFTSSSSPLLRSLPLPLSVRPASFLFSSLLLLLLLLGWSAYPVSYACLTQTPSSLFFLSAANMAHF